MPKKFRKSRRLNATADDLDMSLQSVTLDDHMNQLEILKQELQQAEKRAAEAEQRVAALSQSNAPSTPQSQPDNSLSPGTDIANDTGPSLASSPLKDTDSEPLTTAPTEIKTNKFKTSFDVPLPRQGEFNGTGAWEGFIRPFMGLAEACGWSPEEKKFRLMSGLKGKAAEFVFQQLDPSITTDFDTLVSALESRFAERRTQNAWLALLESRKLSPKESLTEYVADIRRLVVRGYPTADAGTRDSIALRHFLKGLPDQQITVAVGMTNPKTLEEARTAVENYTSLRENVSPGMKTSHRVHAIQTPVKQSVPQNSDAVTQDAYVTQAQMKQFSDNLDRRLAGLAKLIRDKSARQPKDRAATAAPGQSKNGGKGKETGKPAEVTCFKCNEPGHFANKCPQLATKEVIVVDSKSEN